MYKRKYKVDKYTALKVIYFTLNPFLVTLLKQDS